MQRDILLAAVLNTCTLVWILRSQFLIDHIIWKFHIIIWRKFRYFQMAWYPKIFSVSGNFGFYILCWFARYMQLFRGDLPYCTKLAHNHYIKKRKVQNDRQEDLLTWVSFKAQEVFEFMVGSLARPWNWSAFQMLSACWTGPWICTGYLLLKLIACVSSKNNIVPPEMCTGASDYSLQEFF